MTLYDFLALVLALLVVYSVAPYIVAWWRRRAEAGIRVEEARNKLQEDIAEVERKKAEKVETEKKEYYDRISAEKERLGIKEGDVVTFKASGHKGTVRHVWWYKHEANFKLSNDDRNLWKGKVCCTVVIFDTCSETGRGDFVQIKCLMHELKLSEKVKDSSKKPSKGKKS